MEFRVGFRVTNFTWTRFRVWGFLGEIKAQLSLYLEFKPIYHLFTGLEGAHSWVSRTSISDLRRITLNIQEQGLQGIANQEEKNQLNPKC